MRHFAAFVYRARCAAIIGVLVLSACQDARRAEVIAPVKAPLADEIESVNTAAYPEGSYRVKAGDTPNTISRTLTVAPAAFFTANDISTDSILTAGDVMVVPRVELRSDALPAGGGASSAAGASVRQDKVIVSRGMAHAVSAGTVTAVHKGYPGLGDVVIIENDAEKVIYSGSFAPAVAQGVKVARGDLIATGVDASVLRVSRFAK